MGDGKGFTLVELMVVLLIVGLSAMIVVPTLERTLRESELRDATLKLAAVARGLRSRAIYERSLQSLVLNAADNSYESIQGHKVFLSSAVRSIQVKGGEPVAQEVRRFLFFPNGSILGGEVGLSGPGGNYGIRLEPLLGRVIVVKGGLE